MMMVVVVVVLLGRICYCYQGQENRTCILPTPMSACVLDIEMLSLRLLTCLIVVSFWVAVRHGKESAGNKTARDKLQEKKRCRKCELPRKLGMVTRTIAPAAKHTHRRDVSIYLPIQLKRHMMI